ncbi:ABC-type metal ion transporter [Giardia duodenalis]|uniref:ABC-type metal ion transporter n=1 Tax=Giardia intestinalis TaxID=5741 RepID=V6THA4_GIAIN|nr:ABC-type metal ion transporter [Giardia intestinalis]
MSASETLSSGAVQDGQKQAARHVRKGCCTKNYPPPPSDFDKANFSTKRPLQSLYCSCLNPFFTFMSPIIKRSGRQGTLYLSDLHPPVDRHCPQIAATDFVREWNKKVYKGKQPSIILSVIRASMGRFITACIMILFFVAAQMVAPFTIQRISNHLTTTVLGSIGQQKNTWDAVVAVLQITYPYILVVFFGQLIYALSDSILWYLLSDMVSRFLGGTLDILYNKMLSLSDITRQNSAAGNLVNLLFADTMRISNFMLLLIFMMTMPLMFVCYLVYMAIEIDPKGIGGLIALFIILPIVGLILFAFTRLLFSLLSMTDLRVKKISEVLNGMKVVKLFGMEDVQEARVMNIRNKEIGMIFRFGVILSGFGLVVNGAAPLMSLFGFLFFMTSPSFDVANAYTAVFVYNMLGLVFVFMPLMMSGISESKISSKRILTFITLPQPDYGVVTRERSYTLTKGETVPYAIKTSNQPSFCWGLREDSIIPPLLDPMFKDNMKKQRQVLQLYPRFKKHYEKKVKEYKAWKTKNPSVSVDATEEDILLNRFDSIDVTDKEADAMRYIDSWVIEFGLLPPDKVTSFGAYIPQAYQASPDDNPYQVLKKTFLHRIVVRGLYDLAAEQNQVSRDLKKYRKDPARCKQIIDAQLDKNPNHVDLPPRIKNLDLSIPKGYLVGICGPVGAGKTTLFSALLGELRLVREQRAKLDSYKFNNLEIKFDYQTGLTPPASFVEKYSTEDPRFDPQIPHVHIYGSVAYFAQSSCIFSGTLRDNIVFYRPFDRARYEKVLDICCLIPDLKLFKAGDLTEIGEKGVSLSGGQKARVALARAVYSGCDILLLDDPLSAVDSHVGQRLWNEVICGFLKEQGTTVLIASHQTQYFGNCDLVIRIEDGEIVHSDTPDNLMNKGIDFGFSRTTSVASGLNNAGRIESVASQLVIPTQTDEEKRRDLALVTDDGNEAKGKLMLAEAFAQQGSVSGTFYKRWFRSGSRCSLLCYLVFVLLWQGSTQYQGVLINHWVKDQYHFKLSDTDKSYNYKYIGIYAGMTVSTMLMAYLSSVFLVSFINSAARALFKKMLRSIFRSPMSFFDTTPTGRILNRFSKDTDSMDIQVMRFINQALGNGASLVGMLVMICVLAWPALIVVIPTIILYAVIFFMFRRVAPQVKRLESITKSPVINICTESLGALPSIRAYSFESHFIAKAREQITINSSAYWMQISLPRWLSFRLNVIGAFFCGFIALISCVIAPVNIGGIQFLQYAGLILSYSFNIQMILSQFVTAWVQAEAEVTSIERVMEYGDLPAEDLSDRANKIIESCTLASELWPRAPEAGIKVKNLNFRYRPDLDLTLRDCNFEILPGEHVGVVGRTGAGKSSLTVAFFRLAEPDAGSSIVIDNVNLLADVGLHQARQAIAIIPQEPFLFSGTLRQSLCAYSASVAEGLQPGPGVEKVPDEKLWRVLEQVRMREYFEKQPGGLDAKIAANGDNLSAGQRQLVCVARALVREPRCVVLDEATAQVDRENDRLIQDAIRENLADTTIFSIAHRLDTIIDFDRILVVDAGRIAEYDTPANLLRRESSIFSHLVAKTGEETAGKLRAAAFLAEQQRAKGEKVDISAYF